MLLTLVWIFTYPITLVKKCLNLIRFTPKIVGDDGAQEIHIITIILRKTR